MAIEPKSRIIVYCPNCQMNFVTSQRTFLGACPKCDMPVLTRRCNRCGHIWRARRVMQIAKVCPRCKSPYWNRERVRK